MNRCRSTKSRSKWTLRHFFHCFGSKLCLDLDLFSIFLSSPLPLCYPPFFSFPFFLYLLSLCFFSDHLCSLPPPPHLFHPPLSPSPSCRKLTCRTVTAKWPASCRTPSVGTVAPPCSSAALPPATTMPRPSRLSCLDNGRYICGYSQCICGKKSLYTVYAWELNSVWQFFHMLPCLLPTKVIILIYLINYFGCDL